MTAQSGAVTDQALAIIRDLTLGQRIAFVDSLLYAINQTAVSLEAEGHPAGSTIGLAAALAATALNGLKSTIPAECVVRELMTLQALIETARGKR